MSRIVVVQNSLSLLALRNSFFGHLYRLVGSFHEESVIYAFWWDESKSQKKLQNFCCSREPNHISIQQYSSHSNYYCLSQSEAQTNKLNHGESKLFSAETFQPWGKCIWWLCVRVLQYIFSLRYSERYIYYMWDLPSSVQLTRHEFNPPYLEETDGGKGGSVPFTCWSDVYMSEYW